MLDLDSQHLLEATKMPSMVFEKTFLARVRMEEIPPFSWFRRAWAF